MKVVEISSCDGTFPNVTHVVRRSLKGRCGHRVLRDHIPNWKNNKGPSCTIEQNEKSKSLWLNWETWRKRVKEKKRPMIPLCVRRSAPEGECASGHTNTASSRSDLCYEIHCAGIIALTWAKWWRLKGEVTATTSSTAPPHTHTRIPHHHHHHHLSHIAVIPQPNKHTATAVWKQTFSLFPDPCVGACSAKST